MLLYRGIEGGRRNGKSYYKSRGRNRKIINRMMDDGMTGGTRKYIKSPLCAGRVDINGSRRIQGGKGGIVGET